MTFPRSLALAVVLTVPALGAAQTPARAEIAEDEQLLKKAGQKTDGPALLEFFRRRTFGPADQERAAALVGQLGDDTFAVRQNAAEALTRLGPLAKPYLREALKSDDAEVRRRARECLDAVEGGDAAALASAAARLLAVRAPAEAPAVLLNYLPWSPTIAVEEDVVIALLKVTDGAGKPDPAVTAALGDKHAVKRGAAALVVGRSGTDEERRAVRRLLADADLAVRLRAAQGLLAARDAGAVPPLIELLQAAPDVARQAEDLLGRAAGEKAPAVPLGETEAERRKCREAWEIWWKANQGKVDLARAEVDPLLYNPTRRVAEVARRWMDGVCKGDVAALRPITEYPFFIDALEQVTADQFEQLVQQVKTQKMTFTLGAVVNGPQFVRTVPAPHAKILEKLPPRELYGVYVDINENGRKEKAFLVVRVTGSRIRVIGLGDPKANPR